MKYGAIHVPYTVSWTSEERLFIGRCPYVGARAICQDVSPGEGRPVFGKPHANRQREVIAKGLCDLCAKPLRTATKVSLSHVLDPFGGAGTVGLVGEQLGDTVLIELNPEYAEIARRRICPEADLPAETASIEAAA